MTTDKNDDTLLRINVGEKAMKKRILTIGFIGCLVATLLLGCAAKTGEDTKSNKEKKKDLTKYEQILEEGVLTVGTEGTYQPFSYYDEENNLTGYDVEVAKAIAKKMGVQVEFEEIAWDGLLGFLDNGTVDLILNQVGVTEERNAKYDFSEPYVYSYPALITLEDNDKIHSWESARGCEASLNVSSNYADIAARYDMTITTSDTFSKDIELLIAGRTECLINSTMAFSNFVNKKPDTPIQIADILDKPDTVAIPVTKGNEDLLEAVNQAIFELQEDGTLTELSEEFLGRDFSEELTEEERESLKDKGEHKWESRIVSIIVDSFWPILKAGLQFTIPLTLISFALGILLAILVAVIRVSKVKVVDPLCRFYVWVMRGTPLLVQLFVVFFGLPKVGIVIHPLPASIIVFSLSVGAYSSEIFRAAILSIPKGQWEAATSLGMSYLQTLRRIILPQATKLSIPALFNSFISLVKDTSLASTITVSEMFLVTQRITARTYEPLIMYLEVGFIYLIFCTILHWVQTAVERKMSLTAVKKA